MTIRGRVENGVVIPDKSGELPEGAAVQIEVITTPGPRPGKPGRKGGQLKGQIEIADDFDDLPDDIADAFGMRES